MTALTLAAVAAGGAAGAVARYLTMSAVGALVGVGFPYGTLTVNVVGSFVLGVLVELGAQIWSPAPELRAMLVVGFLGAFTTFSTFSLDVIVLIERKTYGPAAAYVAASVVLSVAALFAGMRLMRGLLG
ncbi:MAG: fluoride efflux transporter CrcB [Alphaproteobacteria bacterium]